MISASVQASIDHIERELARRPILPVEPVPRVERMAPEERDSDPGPLRLPHAGPWPCVAGCGARSSTPGVCATCGDRAAREEAEEEFKAALASIPDEFRWARWNSTDLDPRCGWVYDCDGFGTSPSRAIAAMILDKLEAGDAINVLLRGANDSGKTSIACAAGRLAIDRGIDAWIAFMRHRPANRCSKAPPEPPAVAYARGVRVVAARDLLPQKMHAKDHVVGLRDVAIGASLLILDDLCEEVPRIKGVYSSEERLQVTRDVIATRWDMGRPTIGTTTRSSEAILGTYGPGTHKRLARSPRVLVLDVQR